jgi:hypothetical protein
MYLLVLPHIDWEFKKTKEAHKFKNQRLKLLVFGNSTAMDAINTQILSEKLGAAYNFSVGGASLQTNFLQLADYLKQNQKPEKVLLFLSTAHTNYTKANDVNPIIDYYYSSSFHFSGLNDIPLFRFRWLFVENIKKLLSSAHRSAQIVKGQLRIQRMIPDNTSRRTDTLICHDEKFYQSNGYEYMWKIVALCKENGIPVTVFELPCWKDVQNNCADLDLNRDMDNNALQLHMHNLNNVNLCDTLLNPGRDWLSMNHLNYFGSIKVTEEVVRILEK